MFTRKSELKEKLYRAEREATLAVANYEEIKDTVKDIHAEHSEIIKKKNRRIATLEAQNTVFAEDAANELKVTRRESAVSTRENLVEVREADIEILAGALDAHTEAVDKAKETGHKEGYADGLADGLRKATEITQEDRKLLQQVALVAAASHSDKSVQKLLADKSVEEPTTITAGK